jgi:hypothetical protein
VVPMQYVKNEMVLGHALVYLNILEILIQAADLNVLLIQTVIEIKLVLIINAKTLVREHVELMLNAEF